MEKRLMTFIACLFLSIGMALAQTDIDGNFSLSTPAGAKLEITYIGIPVGGINIKIK